MTLRAGLVVWAVTLVACSASTGAPVGEVPDGGGAEVSTDVGPNDAAPSDAAIPDAAPFTLDAFALGTGHTCAALADGPLKCWGWNVVGQLGTSGGDSKVPGLVTGWSKGVVSLSAGYAHTCAVAADGALACWGIDDHGEKSGAKGLTGIRTVGAGQQHTCVLTRAGDVLCWGSNVNGQLGDGTKTSRTTPAKVSGLSGVVALSVGLQHNCVMLATGAVQCWGFNEQGQLGNDSTTNALTPVTPVGFSSGVASISAGMFHTCAVMNDGSLRCFGADDFGQLGDGGSAQQNKPVAIGGLPKVKAVSTGAKHTCALTVEGAVYCFGDNTGGSVGDGTGATGPVIARRTPVPVVGLSSGVLAIALPNAGGYHSCALLADKTLRCWGDNKQGELGDGTTTNRAAPVAVSNFP